MDFIQGGKYNHIIKGELFGHLNKNGPFSELKT